MDAFDQLPRAIGRPSALMPRAARLLVAALSLIAAVDSRAASFLDPPAPPVADEVLLISTRGIGTVCDAARMDRELDCRRLAFNNEGKPTWIAYDWHNLQKSENALRQTLIYVHGNRVSVGYDAAEGIAVYESLINARAEREPVRYIIWSWPSSQIPGLIKDYQVKAVRTNPVAWQLAWFMDQLPVETPLALMGYSFGARAVSGSMHILGGGSIGNLKLDERVHPHRPATRVALMAAAFDADWLLPGEVHQKAITQIERMVVVTNHHDPAMKYFKLSTKIGSTDALGLKGIPQVDKLGTASKRIQHLDVTAEVGRSHVIYDYLADTPKMNRMWQQLLDEDATPLRDEAVPAYAELDADTALR
jgi:hypothetical protein